MLLRGFASQVLKTSSNEVLSSGWVTYPSALMLWLKNFFLTYTWNFLFVACDGDFCHFTEHDDFTSML